VVAWLPISVAGLTSLECALLSQACNYMLGEARLCQAQALTVQLLLMFLLPTGGIWMAGRRERPAIFADHARRRFSGACTQACRRGRGQRHCWLSLSRLSLSKAAAVHLTGYTPTMLTRHARKEVPKIFHRKACVQGSGSVHSHTLPICTNTHAHMWCSNPCLKTLI